MISQAVHSSSMPAGPGLEGADARGVVEGVPQEVVAMVLHLVLDPKETSLSVEEASTGSQLAPAMEGEEAEELTSRVGDPHPESKVKARGVARQQLVHWALAAAVAMDPLQGEKMPFSYRLYIAHGILHTPWSLSTTPYLQECWEAAPV